MQKKMFENMKPAIYIMRPFWQLKRTITSAVIQETSCPLSCRHLVDVKFFDSGLPFAELRFMRQKVSETTVKHLL